MNGGLKKREEFFGQKMLILDINHDNITITESCTIIPVQACMQRPILYSFICQNGTPVKNVSQEAKRIEARGPKQKEIQMHFWPMHMHLHNRPVAHCN